MHGDGGSTRHGLAQSAACRAWIVFVRSTVGFACVTKRVFTEYFEVLGRTRVREHGTATRVARGVGHSRVDSHGLLHSRRRLGRQRKGKSDGIAEQDSTRQRQTAPVDTAGE